MRALGFKAAANLVAENIVALQAVLKGQIAVDFQMDNLPIIHYLNGVAKSSHLGAAGAIADSTSVICARISRVQCEYIPRESHFFRRLAAGIASESLLSFLSALSEQASRANFFLILRY